MLAITSNRISAFVLLLLFSANGANAGENVRTSTQPLTVKNVQNWTENGKVVPVCWETAGYDREKAIVKAAVHGTWERNSGISFTGWGDCPRSGSDKFVRVATASQDDNNGGANGATFGLGMAVLKSAADGAGLLLPPRSMIMTFNPDGSADQGRVEYIGVHEFGHVLGFVHEQDTPGNVEGPAHCDSTANEPNARSLTSYDRDSVMNYCNKDGNMLGNLTPTDIAGVQAVYGVHTAKALGRVKTTGTAADARREQQLTRGVGVTDSVSAVRKHRPRTEAAQDAASQYADARVERRRNDAPAASVRHMRPEIYVQGQGSVRLDWCREWASNCGPPAADAFCRELSPDQPYAADFEMAPDIGRTAIISSRQICTAPSCDGFVHITCVREAPAVSPVR